MLKQSSSTVPTQGSFACLLRWGEVMVFLGHLDYIWELKSGCSEESKKPMNVKIESSSKLREASTSSSPCPRLCLDSGVP